MKLSNGWKPWVILIGWLKCHPDPISRDMLLSGEDSERRPMATRSPTISLAWKSRQGYSYSSWIDSRASENYCEIRIKEAQMDRPYDMLKKPVGLRCIHVMHLQSEEHSHS
jgi:hypothetical protein